MNIIEMVREAGLDWQRGWTLEDDGPNRFIRLVELARADEREACAKISDDADGYSRFVNQFISKRIRARGQQTPEGKTA